jgi:hypothetical protein
VEITVKRTKIINKVNRADDLLRKAIAAMYEHKQLVNDDMSPWDTYDYFEEFNKVLRKMILASQKLQRFKKEQLGE